MKRYHGESCLMFRIVNRVSPAMSKQGQRSGWCGLGQVCLVLLVFFTQSDCVLNKQNAIDETPMTIRVVKGLVAVLPCTVDPVYTEQFSDQYKVVWVSPTDTAISLQDRRLMNDDRLSIERSFLRDWNLHIRNVSLLDAGLYKCQINTNPVGSKKVHLIVQEPPQLIDYTQPTDVEKAEGGEVRLFCNATGSPQPTIKWYRIFKKRNLHKEHISNEGEFLYIKNLTKHCADNYECVAENDVNPSTSQTFKVTVLYPPIVTLYNDRLSQHLGKDTALECYVTASPQGTAGWKHAGKPIVNDPNHEVVVYESQSEADTVILSVRILRIEPQDYGAYSCEATNSLGTGSGTMMLYELSTTTLPTSTTSTTVTSHRVINSKHQKHHGQDNLQSPHDKTLHENQLPSRPQGGSSSQAVAFSDGTKFQGSEGVIVPGASKNGTNCGLCTWWLTLLYIVHTVHMMFS